MTKAESLVFIVEDDDDVRASTRALAEASGFSARDFPNAEAFLRTTEGREADCLIIDYHLSGASGMDLAELLRARGVQTPIIIVTANGRHLGLRAARAGVVAVLRKPLSADALAQWLGEIARNKSQS